MRLVEEPYRNKNRYIIEATTYNSLRTKILFEYLFREY